jgi:hypothetical protein
MLETTFVDMVQGWFNQRRKFWVWTSVFSLASLVVMHLLYTVIAGSDLQVGRWLVFLGLPLLALFVISTFWRGSIQTFLSLAGTVSMYAGMFYVNTLAHGLETLPLVVTNKLGVGRFAEVSSTASLSSLYFFIGLFALVLCLLISLRPSFFRAKGRGAGTSYPVWTIKDDPTLMLEDKSNTLTPVINLLSVLERHVVTKYRYIVVVIYGRTYFVSPDDWVPKGSNAIRDEESGSLLGIPKVPDGFNIG